MASGGKLIEMGANTLMAGSGRKKTGRDWAFSRSSLSFIIRSLEPGI